MTPRRSRFRTTAIAAAGALALLELALPVPSFAAGAEAFVRLRQALDRATDEASLRRELETLAPVLGAKLEEQPGREERTSFSLRLASPLAARTVIAGLSLSRPYATSGDVHQEEWELSSWTTDIDDRWGPRIAVHTPHLGHWAVEPKLAGRPAGELPKLTAGASPAYDLALYDAEVVGLDIELWSDEWQVAEHADLPDTPTAPKSALSRSQIRAWLERHKGYGAPDTAEVELADMRVFVAWNIPWSGRSTTDFWIYCLQDSGWLLLEESTFEPDGELAATAKFDATAHEVRFLGAKGSVRHREPIAACRWDD